MVGQSETLSLRKRVHDALDPPEDQGLSPVTGLLVAFVLISLVSLAIETEVSHPQNELPGWVGDWVGVFNMLIVFVFAAEYIARLWSAPEEPGYAGPGGRIRYMFSPLAVIDLAAFLPEMILTAFYPDASGGILAGLRALRLFRLVKLARYVPAFGIVGDAVKRAGPALLAALAVAAAQLYLAALILYFVEGTTPIPGHPEQMERFGSVMRSLWWAVITLTTVGYGDVFPITPLGRFAAALVAITGIGIVAMPTGILASAFGEVIKERQDAAEQRAAARLIAASELPPERSSEG